MNLIDIQSKANSLENDLRLLKVNELGLSNGGLSYYHFNLGKIKFYNQSNSVMLFRIIEKMKEKDLRKITLIDHGAGIGFFGLLAKKCGIGKIICHDLNKEMIHDCQIISANLGLKFDHFVTGDTSELLAYCKTNHLKVHGLASRNVIEHIHDLDLFFSQLNRIPGSEFVSMITTSANIHNPAVHLQHKRIHKHFEVQGSFTDMMKSEINYNMSGRSIRKRIFEEYAPEIKGGDLELCINNSRALDLKEIKEFIQVYRSSGVIPKLKEKLSNTMDPNSGSWIERLLPIKEYEIIAERNGFSLESLPGFYNNYYHSFFARLASRFLNFCILLLPSFHRTLSPFLALRFIRNRNL
ncbi:MAG: class I SAM-dependent methyltransferase [Saprospiraceae bacterium]